MNIPVSKPPADDGLDWLRDIRRTMSAECNHDPRVMGAKLRALEKQYSHRMFRTRRVLERVVAPPSVPVAGAGE